MRGAETGSEQIPASDGNQGPDDKRGKEQPWLGKKGMEHGRRGFLGLVVRPWASSFDSGWRLFAANLRQFERRGNRLRPIVTQL